MNNQRNTKGNCKFWLDSAILGTVHTLFWSSSSGRRKFAQKRLYFNSNICFFASNVKSSPYALPSTLPKLPNKGLTGVLSEISCSIPNRSYEKYHISNAAIFLPIPSENHRRKFCQKIRNYLLETSYIILYSILPICKLLWKNWIKQVSNKSFKLSSIFLIHYVVNSNSYKIQNILPESFKSKEHGAYWFKNHFMLYNSQKK